MLAFIICCCVFIYCAYLMEMHRYKSEIKRNKRLRNRYERTIKRN